MIGARAADLKKLEELFERHVEERGHFERVQNPLNPRPDINAMLLLHYYDPKDLHMIIHASSDKIFFSANPEIIAEKATEADIIDLIRCSVRFVDGTFEMFV